MKVRVLQQILARRGCTQERISGSHEIWRFPDGNSVPIVVNHKNAEVSRAVMASVRRAARRSGIGAIA